MSQVILNTMAFGALLGGLDHLLGNRFGLGQRFEEAFHLLGSLALSMAGIICLAPVLSQWLGKIIVPLFSCLKLDPGMFGSILAIDMGGYQMAMDLCADSAFGRYSGIVVSAIFGCTIVFTIPVGLGAVGSEDKPYFTKGILLGLVTMPVGLIAGGLLCGLPAGQLLWNLFLILLVSLLLIIGLLKNLEVLIRGFQYFAKGIEKLAIGGLMLGAVQYMTGAKWIGGITALSDAMEIVCSIAIIMLGSMPLAELLQKLLKRPFAWVGKHTGMNSVSTTGLLMGMVSVVPALAMIPRMDKRGKVICGAFVVSSASLFAAHLGFTISTEPELVTALITAKLLGGITGVILALNVTKNENITSS